MSIRLPDSPVPVPLGARKSGRQVELEDYREISTNLNWIWATRRGVTCAWCGDGFQQTSSTSLEELFNPLYARVSRIMGDPLQYEIELTARLEGGDGDIRWIGERLDDGGGLTSLWDVTESVSPPQTKVLSVLVDAADVHDSANRSNPRRPIRHRLEFQVDNSGSPMDVYPPQIRESILTSSTSLAQSVQITTLSKDVYSARLSDDGYDIASGTYDIVEAKHPVSKDVYSARLSDDGYGIASTTFDVVAVKHSVSRDTYSARLSDDGYDIASGTYTVQ